MIARAVRTEWLTGSDGLTNPTRGKVFLTTRPRRPVLVLDVSVRWPETECELESGLLALDHIVHLLRPTSEV